MSAPHRKDYPALWRAQAAELDASGQFVKYSTKQRQEVLRKGYLGRHNPEEALGLAISKFEVSVPKYTGKINNELRDYYDIVGIEARREFLFARTREAQPDDYEPPFEIDEPPGYPYIYESPRLARNVYLKFAIGTDREKNQVIFISCHPPRQRKKVK